MDEMMFYCQVMQELHKKETKNERNDFYIGRKRHRKDRLDAEPEAGRHGTDTGCQKAAPL